MLKSEKFIRDTFSKYFNGSCDFFFNNWFFSNVDTKIREEYTGHLPNGKYCIWAKFEGLIFGSPYIRMVFDDRYHSKSLVRKRFEYGDAKLDGVTNLTLNHKDDSISFEDKSGNKYTLFPCAYNRKVVIYFNKEGDMCVIYYNGKFRLDNSSVSSINK